ncbi:hypothetical protein L484_003097 [Morus notabilis]|uniref:Secreted protein n=1 Tax=Morus notabilis TaxID=981085 RepID=W9R5I5_9ROSA|nr:hypothetical protein L484_003097 [Morus notabilis]
MDCNRITSIWSSFSPCSSRRGLEGVLFLVLFVQLATATNDSSHFVIRWLPVGNWYRCGYHLVSHSDTGITVGCQRAS